MSLEQKELKELEISASSVPFRTPGHRAQGTATSHELESQELSYFQQKLQGILKMQLEEIGQASEMDFDYGRNVEIIIPGI